MGFQMNLGGWNGVFAVPNAVIDVHGKLAGKNQLLVLLFLLRHSGKTCETEEIAQALGITTDGVLDALEFWQERQLVAEAAGELTPASAPHEGIPARAAPSTQEISPPKAAPSQGMVLPSPGTVAPSQGTAQPPQPAPNEKLPPAPRLQKPDTAHLVARTMESPEIQYLLQEAELTLGKTVSPALAAVLLSVCDDYGLPPEVVTMLLHYCKAVGKMGTAYIDAVARDWAAHEVFTLEAAEDKLRALSESRQAWSQVQVAAGLPQRSPSKKEEEAAVRWVVQWKFTQPMLAAAYERCVDGAGKFSVAYMNKILERWHGQGFTNPGQVTGEEQKKTQEQQRETSYDIDSFTEMRFFDPPEEW